MKISHSFIKGTQAIFLENENIFAAILPGLGGKIAKLTHKKTGFEFAAQTKGEYKRPAFGSNFADFDASGIDDAFPSINASYDTASGWEYPDHGEIWSSVMSEKITGHHLKLDYKSPLLPYTYTKTVSLSTHGLILDYHIENISDSPFPCIWTFHGLMRYEEDMRVIYPKDCKAFINTLKSPQLGNIGIRYLAKEYDFTRPPLKESLAQIKYYLEGEAANGRCGFWYPSQNTGIMLYYDPTILPYLGVWITAGGFRGDYNCALEPCNGFYDDIETARQNGALYSLKPDKPLAFRLVLELNG